MMMTAPVMTSCSSDLEEVAPIEEVKSNIVTITIAPPVAEPETRVAMGADGLSISGWELNDKVILYKVSGSPCTITGEGITFTCINVDGTFSGDLGTNNLSDYTLAVFGATAMQMGVNIALIPSTICSTDIKSVVMMYAWKNSGGTFTMELANNVLKINNGTGSDVEVAWSGKYRDDYDNLVGPEFFIPMGLFDRAGNRLWGVPVKFSYRPENCQGWDNTKFTLKTGVNYVNMGMVGNETDEWGLVKEDGTEFLQRKTMTGRLTVKGKLYNAGTIPATGTAKATIGGSEVDVKWVQLWAGGPKFAEYNVGVTDSKAESFGGYYAWGGSQDKVDDHKTGSEALSGDSDTATKLWGTAWRMPTQAEFKALYFASNCTVEWTTVNGVNGRKFTGKGDYSSNSVFLPAAGSYNNGVSNDGVNGYYWSTTPVENNNGFAYRLFFSSASYNANFESCKVGYSVRAVLKE